MESVRCFPLTPGVEVVQGSDTTLARIILVYRQKVAVYCICSSCSVLIIFLGIILFCSRRGGHQWMHILGSLREQWIGRPKLRNVVKNKAFRS